MSKIDELLKNEKVEWKRLGEVCETVTDYVAAGSFKSNSKNVIYLNSPDYAQLVRTKDIKSNFNNKEIFVYVDKKAFDYLYRVNLDEECLILPNIGNCGEVYHILPEKLPYKNNVLGPNAILLKSKTENMKFLYYLFCSKNFQKNLYKITSKTGQGKFNKTDLKEIIIPIPPLEVQEKIVNRLDKFTKHITELQYALQAELQMRIQQYEYYRDLMLSEEYLNKLSANHSETGGYKLRFVTLGEIANISRGASPRPIKNFITDDDNGIPWIKIGDTQENVKYICSSIEKINDLGAKKAKLVKKGDFIISNSMSYGRPFILGIDGAVHDGWAIISDYKKYLDTDFLYHYLLSTNVKKYWTLKLNTSSVSNLNSDIIKSLKIPIVNLEIQKQIASTLDKFHTIVHDLKIALPREIELRQQQYEYYREKLLNFNKAN